MSCQVRGERTVETTRYCNCEQCKEWWVNNVPGYFLCAACQEVCYEAGNKYDGMCGECWDEAQPEPKL